MREATSASASRAAAPSLSAKASMALRTDSTRSPGSPSAEPLAAVIPSARSVVSRANSSTSELVSLSSRWASAACGVGSLVIVPPPSNAGDDRPAVAHASDGCASRRWGQFPMWTTGRSARGPEEDVFVTGTRHGGRRSLPGASELAQVHGLDGVVASLAQDDGGARARRQDVQAQVGLVDGVPDLAR